MDEIIEWIHGMSEPNEELDTWYSELNDPTRYNASDIDFVKKLLEVETFSPLFWIYK